MALGWSKQLHKLSIIKLLRIKSQQSVEAPTNVDGGINMKLADDSLKDQKVNVVAKFDFYIVSKNGWVMGSQNCLGYECRGWDSVDDINKDCGLTDCINQAHFKERLKRGEAFKFGLSSG